jgi:hypothetical protein
MAGMATPKRIDFCCAVQAALSAIVQRRRDFGKWDFFGDAIVVVGRFTQAHNATGYAGAGRPNNGQRY